MIEVDRLSLALIGIIGRCLGISIGLKRSLRVRSGFEG